MGDTYLNVILLIWAWFVAVANCQSIIYDAPKAWGGKNWIFPWKWYVDRKTPCFFRSILTLTYFFNICVIVVPLTLFLVPSYVDVSDYPIWAQENSTDSVKDVVGR